jgi:hypothetical protein
LQAVFILQRRILHDVNEGAIVTPHIAQAKEKVHEEREGETLREQNSAQKRDLCRDRRQVVDLATKAV